MAHVPSTTIHVYAGRGHDIRISVDTEEDTGDFSSITFRTTTGIEYTGLTADDTSGGFDVDLTIEASDLTETVKTDGDWELVATFGGEVRPLAWGPFVVDPAITS